MAHVGRKIIFSYSLSALIVAGVFCLRISATNAATVTYQRASEIQVGATQRWPIFGNFKGGATVAVGDVNADGLDEYVVGAGPTGGPQVLVLNQAGQTLSSFFAYDSKNRDGINVAVGDIDGDGVAEIITAPQAGSKPEVRVYTMAGVLIRKFTAFESAFLGGVNVAVIPARGGVTGNIIASSGFGHQAEIKVFDYLGKKVVTDLLPRTQDASNGVTVAAGWSNTFDQNILIVGASQGEKPLVQIYSATSKEKFAQWLAYDEKVKTGMSVGYHGDIVVTGPSAGGGPDARTYTVRGDFQSSALVFEKNFRGGLNVGLTIVNGILTTVAVPTTSSMTAASSGKSIVVSLSKQTLTMMVRGRVVSIRRVSTGKASTPTPTGSYTIHNKIPIAYSKAYGLYMENWMAFQADGSMGLHSLPFWKLKNGGRLYEGASHIGTPVSHGCIRQTLVESKSLYDWAPIGTPVTIVS